MDIPQWTLRGHGHVLCAGRLLLGALTAFPNLGPKGVDLSKLSKHQDARHDFNSMATPWFFSWSVSKISQESSSIFNQMRHKGRTSAQKDRSSNESRT
jgi:hypothetical protein